MENQQTISTQANSDVLIENKLAVLDIKTEHNINTQYFLARRLLERYAEQHNMRLVFFGLIQPWQQDMTTSTK